MTPEALKPGLAFRFHHVAEDVFFFAFSSTLIQGDGLYRRFNRAGAFIAPEWYRFPINSPLLTRAKEFDVVG